MSIVNGSLQNARATTAAIAASSAVPLDGQIVYNSQTGQYKIGDGVTTLSALTYYGGSGALTINSTTITSGTNTRILYNNNGVVGEYTVTGTGTTAVLSTSPTFLVGLTTPVINPSTFLNIGNAAVAGGSLSKMRVGLGVSYFDFGEAFGDRAALWLSTATPTSGTYSIAGTAAGLSINASAVVSIEVGTSAQVAIYSNRQVFAPLTSSASGAVTNFTFTTNAHTNQTLSTNIPNFKVTGSTKQWATGALATQYFNYFSANTVSFVGASTATDVFNMYIDDCVQGTNATITNKYSLGLAGALQVPTIVGGSAVGSTIQYKGTSGIGTSTVAAHQFLVGNNGATTAMSVYNSGQINVGNYASPLNLRLFTIGQDTAYMSFGSLVGSTSATALYMNQATPSGTNYFLSTSSSGANSVNGGVSGTNFSLRVNNTDVIVMNTTTVRFSPLAVSAGNPILCQVLLPAVTGQTTATNAPSFKVTGSTKQWATGALATQYFNYFSANTVSFVGASTATHVANFRSDAPLQGTNATATNLYAIDCGGHMFIANSVGVPSNNPTGGGILYVESGALKYRSSNGTVTTVGPL